MSTVLRLFKAIRILGVLVLILYFAGVAPKDFTKILSAKLSFENSKRDSSKVTPTAVAKANQEPVLPNDEDLCLPMGERDRKLLASSTGTDVIQFLEQAALELHSAKAAEEQLKVMGLRFDHQNWSKAWNAAGGDSESAASSESALQANLSHASMVLSRYNRLLENGRRQETSALKAFHWQEEVRQEIRREPVRILVQSYSAYTCSKADASYYGCASGEAIYRVKALMSPRIACRFKDKREQYSVVYWIRVKDKAPKILEVDARGNRLVKVTYDELVHRKLLSALSPNVSEVLQSAGLDPFRAMMLWRKLNGVGPFAVADESRGPAGSAAADQPASAKQSATQPTSSIPAYQTDSY